MHQLAEANYYLKKKKKKDPKMYNGSSSVVSMNSTAQSSSPPRLHPEARLTGVSSVSTTGIAEEGCWEMPMGWCVSSLLEAHWLWLSHMAPPTLKGAGKRSPSWQPPPKRIPDIRRQSTLSFDEYSTISASL